MSDNQTQGDARKPGTDRGDAQGNYAQTHGVRQEELMNPQGNPAAVEDDGPRPTPEEFAEESADQTPQHVRQQHLEADSAGDDKTVGNMLPELTDDELSRLPILDPGTPLEQGSVYFNLKDRAKGPFKAIGGQEVGQQDKMIAKKMTDYELWNEIVGRDDNAEVERPAQEHSS